MVRYELKPDSGAQGEELVCAVYDELRCAPVPAGTRKRGGRLCDLSSKDAAMNETDPWLPRDPPICWSPTPRGASRSRSRATATSIACSLRRLGSRRKPGRGHPCPSRPRAGRSTTGWALPASITLRPARRSRRSESLPGVAGDARIRPEEVAPSAGQHHGAYTSAFIWTVRHPSGQPSSCSGSGGGAPSSTCRRATGHSAVRQRP
jgi:hypothetical protein